MRERTNLISIIIANNQQRLVKIRYTRKANGTVVLFLDHYKNGERERKHIGVVLSMNPDNRKLDIDKIRYAEIMRAEAEKIILAGGSLEAFGIPRLFYDYAVKLVEDKNKKNKLGYLIAINHFHKMYPNLPLSDLTNDKVTKFINSISSLKPSTINHYVGYMRYICTQAVKGKLLKENPFLDIRKKKTDQTREYLDLKELDQLHKTDCESNDTKRAFLWSCYTGMRLGDILEVSGSQIEDCHLSYRQNKTGQNERVKLCDQALEIAGETKGPLFSLPAYKTMRKHLNKWVEDARINKKITFHCARHTYATLLVTLGIDIYVVSKLLGHSNVSTTQIYAKIVDSKMDKAIDVLTRNLNKSDLLS